MKPKYFIAGLSAIAFTATAYADVEVNITGATAFRASAFIAIKAKYDVGNGGVDYKYGHNGVTGDLNASNPLATTAIFSGNFPGVPGTTTIRCTFSGSVEGIRSLVGVTDPLPPKYYKTNLLTGGSPTDGGKEYAALSTASGNVETATSHIAFSDVSKASTPYGSFSLLPGSPAAGVIVFSMVTNDGSAITNVTSQQFRALMSGGLQPRSMFTNNVNDNPDGDTPGANAGYVFATGRNDGSGTRTTYLAETGFGIVKTVKQYVVTAASGDQLTSIRLVPQGGVGVNVAYASTVWGQDLAGNGGYSSGGTVATDMGNKGASVNVLNAAGSTVLSGIKADLVSWLGVSDAIKLRNLGGSLIGYNGVTLSEIAAGGIDLGNNDVKKIVEGTYTAWGYENMYMRNDVAPGSDVDSVYTTIKAALPAYFAAAGLPISGMHVGRPADGGTVAP